LLFLFTILYFFPQCRSTWTFKSLFSFLFIIIGIPFLTFDDNTIIIINETHLIFAGLYILFFYAASHHNVHAHLQCNIYIFFLFLVSIHFVCTGIIISFTFFILLNEKDLIMHLFSLSHFSFRKKGPKRNCGCGGGVW